MARQTLQWVKEKRTQGKTEVRERVEGRKKRKKKRK